ncbi:hypothetical protein Lal_00006639 [Lupinus albus]|uniref:Uncharacterized protein n=1 Tax=Lupinus albus TaxID=3870 RepID=A0A6A5MUP0_LUPAL|nr:hypothetical protein Lalb_Chr07g0179201 [Lupinus albus]KAF1876008.1 hypothetical protein Lal_00006639 [Lupinus albus]
MVNPTLTPNLTNHSLSHPLLYKAGGRFIIHIINGRVVHQKVCIYILIMILITSFLTPPFIYFPHLCLYFYPPSLF